MPSDAENFLGIDEKARPSPPEPKGILSKRWVWVVTLVLSYCFSITWLTGAIVCVPYVIWLAPLGLTSLFDPPINAAHARVAMGIPEYLVHLVFWTLFLTGLIGCEKIDRLVLRGIFFAVLLILLLTMHGCAEYYHINTADIN